MLRWRKEKAETEAVICDLIRNNIGIGACRAPLETSMETKNESRNKQNDLDTTLSCSVDRWYPNIDFELVPDFRGGALFRIRFFVSRVLLRHRFRHRFAARGSGSRVGRGGSVS